MPEKKLPAPFYEKLALVLIGLIALTYLIILGKDLLDPLIFGFLFSIMLLPVASFLEKKLRFPRSMSSLAAILLIIAFVGGILYLVGSQVSNLAEDWPKLKSQVSQSLSDLSMWIQHAFHINASKQMGYVQATTKTLMASGGSVLEETFGAVSSILIFFVFILIFTFFFLLYRRQLMRFIVWVFNHDHSSIVHDIVENVQSILRQYILGLLLEMVVVATLACTIFLLIGVKYAMLMGLLIGLFNVIPYLGIFSALFLSCIITFATGNIKETLYVAIGVVCVHEVDTNFLLPTIVGSKVKLNAMVTFIGLIFGEMVWGISGMFLSIPIMAILKIIFDRVESLKPWGYLLGSDNEGKKSKKKKLAVVDGEG